ncbi:MAG: sorbosone dehydrogenase family protein [Alphaproteobacteria bacterium]|nr:sorbosone dehydrogenase family protein [Alphaproteobacteria bacterium]
MKRIALLMACLSLSACDQGHPPPTSNTGAAPTLPKPDPQNIPTIRVNSVAAWADGASPTAPAGFAVTRYAEKLEHPRWLYRLPNGDVLVAEAAPPLAQMNSLEGIVEHWVDTKNGSAPPSANRITLLRDADGDGRPETRSVFLSGLDQNFGMLLLDGWFYVANTGSVVRYPYKDGETAIAEKGEKILDLPVGHHWTRNLIASPDGRKIYVTVGSGSNIADKGDIEKRRADILEIDPDGKNERVLASGLRNPNGLGYEPRTGALWTVVNERDMLGDDLVPDYLTRVKDGAFYGWPWSYWGRHVDDRVQPQNPAMVAKAITPDYALGAHVAALGLAFYTADAFPAHYRGGAFIGEHGSWNRAMMTGYKVVYVPFADGRPAGAPEDFLTGFLPDVQSGVAHGRPVGVALDAKGALLVADDVGNIVWRIAPKS